MKSLGWRYAHLTRALRQAAISCGIVAAFSLLTYPILLDQKGRNWSRWSQQFWPTVYLLDKQGHVRYRWDGELEFDHAGGESFMADRIEELLRE